MSFFKPLLAGATLPGRLIACVGAVIGIGLTIIVCGGLPPLGPDLPIIVAPLGASAVLVFAVPASPLAQPWSVVGGNVLSTLVGVAAFQAIPSLPLAAGCAVGGAILVMSLARCLHPPGGAAALTAVIGSQGIHAAGFAFAFAPVAINSIALVAIGMAFHRATGRSYPHEPAVMPPAASPALIGPEDVDAALEEMHESFDIAREDLDTLLAHAERHARARTGPVRGKR
ncbi:HPP family protein [Sphingomonas sanguinis]|jgi:CBS domain-containing membrane protein|uniref:HPP family protein n=1 Tax=Sphingomonas sanguinis TaxID=33051 RepID=A0A7Y7UR17_9SPHN|nr:HPP family protein [Sphingomonas sanguinis]MBZ6382549.1 HPP family protein [Sphingomonas sanguinis]NNG49810.1 HPP family protein [Sphingomonas sanguinis]NNG54766.1 HPP family protein [Sphingomonas sanguinis]NVP31847.1 HPP family protein [Sphingomonas sanguinis]